MKKQFVDQLNKDEQVNDIFVLHKIDKKNYKNKPGTYLQLILGDKTGTIIAKYWGNDENETEGIYKFFSDGEVFRISGKVGEYMGTLDISMNPGIKLEKIIDYDRNDLIPKTNKDVPQMIQTLKDEISKVSNPHIKQLLESFSNDDKFMEKYSTAPAAKKMHHDYIGGLLEHVLNLITTSKAVQSSHPKLDLDLLVAACILHDIGKVDEYEVGLKIDFSDDGRFYGHISIGYRLVAKMIENIPDFPKELERKILHMILSHHGELEYGSPVKPNFLEAVAFHHIDNTDASIQHVKQIIEKEEGTKDWFYSGGREDRMFYTK